MKVIIIGSKGFIGQQVMIFFQAQSIEVWGCDVVTDYGQNRYFQIDATNSDFDSVFNSHQFDACVNCSGAASVPDSFVNPSRDFQLNVVNVQHLLDAIRKHSPLCKFLNLSSAAVYGNPKHLPIRESDTLQPLSPYGWHKLYAEQLCSEYHHLFGLRTCSARIFSAYGPGLMKQLFWDWHKKISSQGELRVLGTGKESRDFIYVEDVARAVYCIVTRGDFAGGAFNVGNGEEVFIAEALKIFKENYTHHFEYTFSNEARKGDPINWKCDNAKLCALGYQPSYSITSGLKQYISWLRLL